MGGSSGLWMLVCVLGLLSSGRGEDSCRVQGGSDGAAGQPGMDGRNGAKGEKGEPAPVAQVDGRALLAMKGDAGNRGPVGEMGPKGYHGDLGPEGVPGASGFPGPAGESGGPSQLSRSAFSVVRTDNTFARYNQKITFQNAITNTNSDFDLNAGLFTCKEPGVYYFVFHSMSKADMCLNLRSDAIEDRKLVFCDYSNKGTSQVLSGGVVLTLVRGQKVWLEMYKDQQSDNTPNDTSDKKIVFNGFLIFSTT